jgi:PAS domain S-box-containing protein/putative nucleotidyltransferase with HDIG domain
MQYDSSPTRLGPDDAYRRLLDAMPVMLWTAEATGRWTHVNNAWIRYTGVLGESRGFGFEAALHPDDEARTVAAWQAAVTRGADYQIDYRLRHQSGRYRWFLIRGVRVPPEEQTGQDAAWVGTCTDIQEQKQAELDALAAREAAVRTLGLALETRDRETKGHTDRVTDLALRLGRTLGLDAAHLDALRLGAYLHDIGKIGVPDMVLLKPGPLDPSEWALMSTHVVSGVQFARTLDFLPDEALQLIADHHERWDGGGYPRGLRGEAISLLGRVFAVVDVYDALVSERPYKPAWLLPQVRAELAAQSGRHFDPAVVAAFLALDLG